jgi:hypothetical protein
VLVIVAKAAVSGLVDADGEISETGFSGEEDRYRTITKGVLSLILALDRARGRGTITNFKY